MNQVQMRKALQINVNDIRGSRFDTETCRILLNQSIQHIWNDLINKKRYYNRKSININFTTEQEIDAANDIQKILIIKDEDGNVIDIVDEDTVRYTDIKPAVYVIHKVLSSGGPATGTMVRLGWFEIPTSSFTLTVDYIPLVSQFSEMTPNDSEVIFDIPLQYHLLIPSWATVIALAGDEKSVDYWSSIYDRQMQQIIESGSYKPEPKEVTNVDNWYS